MPTDNHGREAAQLLGQVYQISSSALRKLGEHELAWLAADRSMAVSQRAGDQMLAGTATTRVALALLALGRSRAALEINVNIANRLAPGSEGNETSPERLSVYGQLLLQGAMAAARIGDSATVRDLLASAQEAADQLGGDFNYYWTCFGPTNVQLHRAAAAVELGEGRQAVERAREDQPGRLRRAAARAAGPPLPRPRAGARPDRRHRERQRDAARGRSAGPLRNSLPAARP